MGYEYNRITVAQRRAHLEQRIVASEADHFAHATTLRMFKAQAGTATAIDAEAIEGEEKIVKQLEQAIVTLREMLLELPDVPPANRTKPPVQARTRKPRIPPKKA